MWLTAPPRLHSPPRGPLLLLVRPKGLKTKAMTLFLTEEEVRGEDSTPCLMQRPPLDLVSGWFKWRWGWNIEAPNVVSGREPAHPRNAGPRSPNESWKERKGKLPIDYFYSLPKTWTHIPPRTPHTSRPVSTFSDPKP